MVCTGHYRAWPGWHRALLAGLSLQNILSSQEGPAIPQKHEGCRPQRRGWLKGQHPEGLGRASALLMSLSLASTFFLILSMSDGLGTTGAPHNSLQWFPALLGRQIPRGECPSIPPGRWWQEIEQDGHSQQAPSSLLSSSFWSLHVSLSAAASKLSGGDNSLQQHL